MAVIGSAMKREGLRRWVQTSQEKARRLLTHAETLSESVFSTPDSLKSFLDLTSRLHHYDAYNLLLIWEAYPSASYLAGYKVWEKMLQPGDQVLKDEFKGKGIDIIAPFTDGSTSQNCLVWYSQSVFDVTQTTLTLSPPSFDPGYILDDDHEYFLLHAIRQVLGTRFGRSVIIKPATQLMQEIGLPGQISEDSVAARDDLPQQELMQWLTEAMAQLAVEWKALSPPSMQLIRDCIRHCLFRIWGLERYSRPPSSTIQMESVAPRQMEFLHLLRDNVRDLNNLVCSCYLSKREEEDELDLFELEKAIQTSG